jgi:2-(1,2-epoxy-1,2-dihydrophenyl)acetyl-CoA isomerase
MEFVTSETRGKVLILTMSDPKTRNALGVPMAEELIAEMDRFEADPDLRVLVLTGADPSFCSGANVRGFDRTIQEREHAAAANGETAWEQLDPGFYATIAGHSSDLDRGVIRVVRRLVYLQKPSIAAVNGHAYGIGHGIAVSCDFRIASEKGLFCEAFVRNGLIPADGSCWQLPNIIGMSNALWLQFAGHPVNAEDALRMGLCS